MSSPTSFRVLTFGCKVNQYESELMREQLVDCGMVERHDDMPADLYIVNTCTVTQHADAKCRKAIRHIARDNPNARIIVTGCYAERDAVTLRKLPNVEAVIDNSGKEKLVEKIFNVPCDTKSLRGSIVEFEDRTRAFIKIQDGCNEFCSYCIIPYVRGKPRSREIVEIVKEAGDLVANGYREIVLTGIHIGCFGRTEDKIHMLPELIHELKGVEGLVRLRLSSIDPNEVNDELISAIAESPIACSHLHISLQSGSTRVLQLMNRKYTAEKYLALTDKLYSNIPDISISTDIMVGFPGETDADFDKSRDMVEKVKFSKVHIFPYSPREGTAAVKLRNQIPQRTAHERNELLTLISSGAAKDFREKFFDRVMEVLIERGADKPNEYEGFTNNYLRSLVNTGKQLQKNCFVKAKIESFDHKYLYCKLEK